MVDYLHFFWGSVISGFLLVFGRCKSVNGFVDGSLLTIQGASLLGIIIDHQISNGSFQRLAEPPTGLEAKFKLQQERKDDDDDEDDDEDDDDDDDEDDDDDDDDDGDDGEVITVHVTCSMCPCYLMIIQRHLRKNPTNRSHF